MEVIPIYDDTVPITCTASVEEIPVRIEVIERMHAALDRIERTEHGVLLRFPNRPDVAEDLRGFVVDEKGCCQFWGFALTATGEAITLRWDGPPAVDDLMDRLYDYFSGDDAKATTGLL